MSAARRAYAVGPAYCWPELRGIVSALTASNARAACYNGAVDAGWFYHGPHEFRALRLPELDEWARASLERVCWAPEWVEGGVEALRRLDGER